MPYHDAVRWPDDESAARSQPAAAGLGISGDETHIWRIAQDAPAEEVARLFGLLSEDERERAARFSFERDQTRFVVGRATVRRILARYLDTPPKSLRFTYGPRGKPALAPGSDTMDLCFNLAHSDGLALLVVARGRAVGIDVERVHPSFAFEAVAERFFSPAERDALRALPEQERRIAFYTGWVRKEAYIKARGEGMALPLEHFAVSLAPGASPALLAVDGHPDEPARWTLRDVEAGEGFAAALAVEGRLANVCYTAAI